MDALPRAVGDLLLAHVQAERKPAWVTVDGAGRVRHRGGALAFYGIGAVPDGAQIAEHVPALVGQIPAGPAGVLLPAVTLEGGVVADLHLRPAEEGTLVLLLDATADAVRQGVMQQKGNELRLLREQAARTADALGELPARLGIAVLAPAAAGRYTLRARAPDWLRRVWPDAVAESGFDPAVRSPFLSHFLDEARAHWDSGSERPLESDVWTEVDADGTEHHVQARAVRAGGERLLLLVEAAATHAERSHFLQRARANALEHQRLVRDVEKKDVLLSCIVHDLRSPISAVISTLDFLDDEVENPKSRQLLEGAVAKLRHQDVIITSILDVFRTDLEELRGARAVQAVDALAAARECVETFAPLARLRNVTLTVETGAAPVPAVRAEATRLERVFANLVDNALRHSAPGQGVRITLARADDQVEAAVEDSGRGVPAALVPRLFDRFAQGDRAGAAGLGLHFCRLTVEAWGGTIGYADRPEGGARFWFRIPAADQDAER